MTQSPQVATFPDVPTARRRLLIGVAVGAAAALIASALILLMARHWQGVHIAQLLSDRLTAIVPLAIFREGLERLESNAKPVAMAGLTLGQILIGALIGGFYSTSALFSRRRRAAGAVLLFMIVWTALSLIAAPLSGIAIFGRSASVGLLWAQTTFVVTGVAFAMVVALFVPWPVSTASRVDPARRQFIGLAGLAVLAVPASIAGLYIGRFTRSLQGDVKPTQIAEDAATRSPFSFPGMPRETTPNDEFYIVSKNFIDPSVDETSWSFEVAGMVERPMTLSYSEVLRRPLMEITSTMECISNPVGGDFISTAVWEGFSLSGLLEDAGMLPGVVDLELHAADDYLESITLSEAMAENTIVVHTMNGEPLPILHGFPLRLIVPGIYGLKSVKWLTQINPVDEDVRGYWQQRDWVDHAPVWTMSKVSTPVDGQRVKLDTPRNLGGVAFAGDRGISQVEVSLDDGHTWRIVELSEPLSPLTWRLWKLPLELQEAGEVPMLVRAVDGAGEVQTSEERDILPSGSTGWHRVSFSLEV
jgi:DMSO/TMAO reductase YedYZ molybdopterin-dependent catalytic subunit